MRFLPINEHNLHIAHEIYNSNPSYNRLENGKPTRTMQEMRDEFLQDKTESYLIYSASTPVAVLDFLPHNPKDGFPWIGLMMVNGQFHSKGFGAKAYQLFERKLVERGFTSIRLAVLKNNVSGKMFWNKMGFSFYQMSTVGENDVECLERTVSP